MRKPTARPTEIKYDGRSTGTGARTEYHIFSLRQKKKIGPHRTEKSRTEHHWENFWYLLKGSYFICWQNISNSGKHSCGYGCLVVEKIGEIEEWFGEVPDFVQDTLCGCLRNKLGITAPAY